MNNLQLTWDVEDLQGDMLEAYQAEIAYLANHETIEENDRALNNTNNNLAKLHFDELIFHYNDFKSYSKEVENEIEVSIAKELYKQELLERVRRNPLLKLRLPIELLFKG